MKKTAAIAAVILALGAGFSAQAQTFNQGDILLGFEKLNGSGPDTTGVGTEVIFDLGTTGSFSSINLDMSSTSSLLATTYGTNWNSSGLVSWAVFGANNASGTSRGVTASTTPAAFNGGYTFSAAVNAMWSSMGSMYADWGASAVTTNTVGGYNYVSYAAASTGGNVWSTTDLGGWSSGLTGPMAVGLVDPATLSVEYMQRSGTTNSVGTLQEVGGVISAVPEPSTYVLFGLGALALMIVYRRRNA